MGTFARDTRGHIVNLDKAGVINLLPREERAKRVADYAATISGSEHFFMGEELSLAVEQVFPNTQDVRWIGAYDDTDGSGEPEVIIDIQPIVGWRWDGWTPEPILADDVKASNLLREGLLCADGRVIARYEGGAETQWAWEDEIRAKLLAARKSRAAAPGQLTGLVITFPVTP